MPLINTEEELISNLGVAIAGSGGGGGGSGTVTSVSAVGNNGITVSVLNPTTTPQLEIGLNNITPTSVSATGTVAGSNLSGTNTGDETKATIETKLGVASSINNGYLSSIDWNTFNSKQSTLNITTVGATKGQYQTVRDAITAGATSILIIENTTETGTASITINTQNTNILLAPNVVWDTSSINASALLIPGTNPNAYLYIETASNSLIIYKPTVNFASFVNTTSNSPLNNAVFERGNFNLDMSTMLTGINGITGVSILRNIGTIKSIGKTEIKIGNNSACGIRYVGVNTDIQENAEIVITAGGPSCNNVISYSQSTAQPNFNNSIFLNGVFSSATNIIDINANIKNIYVKSATAINLQLGGNINGLFSRAAPINVTISNSNTTLSNADLKNGTLNINNQLNFKSYSIINAIFTNPLIDSFVNQQPRQFRISINKTLPASINILNGVSQNLFALINQTDIDNATKISINQFNTDFSYSVANSALIFPSLRFETHYQIRLLLTGTIGGSSGTDRDFNIEFRRGADNSVVLIDDVIKLSGNDLAELSRTYITFTNNDSGTDPYISGGLRLVLNNISGTTITLTGFRVLIIGSTQNIFTL